MQLSKGLAAIALFAISSNSVASECPLSTTPRALFAGVEHVAREYFDPKMGKYSAVLKDDSSVTARFELCGLGMRASYLIRRETDDLAEYIRLLLVNAIPPESTASAVASQAVKHTEEDLRTGVTLHGANGDHWIQTGDSPSPLYTAVIHYRWIPPEH